MAFICLPTLHKPPQYSNIRTMCFKKPQIPVSSISKSKIFEVSFPLAASISILLWSSPENNQKKYAELDSNFKSSTVLKDLLEKSKLNKEKNKKEIEDKYCLRGAEWGVGDCSTQGMTQQERDDFIAMLKKNAGVEE